MTALYEVVFEYAQNCRNICVRFFWCITFYEQSIKKQKYAETNLQLKNCLVTLQGQYIEKI
jgi:hypothetical protein